eukprot:8591207-Pyramimonas_sp.AAC.1
MFLEQKPNVIKQDSPDQKCPMNISWEPQKASQDASPLLDLRRPESPRHSGKEYARSTPAKSMPGINVCCAPGAGGRAKKEASKYVPHSGEQWDIATPGAHENSCLLSGFAKCLALNVEEGIGPS